MDEQTFWDLVDSVGHDFDRLADALSDHGAEDIRDFADHLARALHALDTPAHFRAVQRSGASFLGVRCAAVAAGASAYRQVLSAPDRLARYADRPAAQLIPVAERAYRISTRTDWHHEPAVDTGTGANTAAWGTSWLHPHMATATGEGGASTTCARAPTSAAWTTACEQTSPAPSPAARRTTCRPARPARSGACSR
jgi:hypothetical protein